MTLSTLRQLNLSRNPFGEPPLTDRPLLAQVAIEEPLALLRTRPRAVVQYLGECGRGKSTHMHALRAAIAPEAPYLYIAPDHTPRLPCDVPVLCVDETQRLGWWARRRLWRGDQALIIATHRDHSREILNAGRPLHAVMLDELSEARLRAILQARIDWAIHDPSRPTVSLSSALIEGAAMHFGADVRAILSQLYEIVQRMDAVGPIPWPPDAHTLRIAPSRHRGDDATRAYHSTYRET